MQIGCIHPNKGCVYFVYPPSPKMMRALA